MAYRMQQVAQPKSYSPPVRKIQLNADEARIAQNIRLYARQPNVVGTEISVQQIREQMGIDYTIAKKVMSFLTFENTLLLRRDDVYVSVAQQANQRATQSGIQQTQQQQQPSA